jgi:hypothetical protein
MVYQGSLENKYKNKVLSENIIAGTLILTDISRET